MDLNRYSTDELTPGERQLVRYSLDSGKRLLNLWLAFLLTIIMGGFLCVFIFGIRWGNVFK